ncbi:MAG: signal peptidase I [Spirochaetia bacterium]|nr:signal peptidase I [Spirochaetia bacterium]
MGKYYKFPRRYYNRNKVRKPLKPKHILQLALLCVAFYLLCSALFIGTYRAGNDSMSPWCGSRDTLIGIRSWYTALERGDVVLYRPSYYHNAPLWLRFLDSAVQVCTFRIVHLAEFFGYDTGYTAKRVVGLPGDTVKIVGSQAYIQPPGSEIYISEADLGLVDKITPTEVQMLKKVPPVKVEEGCYYLLSDNRNFLSDSRSMGTVEKKRIHAKVIYRLKGLGKQ